jgi:hypothetical protein
MVREVPVENANPDGELRVRECLAEKARDAPEAESYHGISELKIAVPWEIR